MPKVEIISCKIKGSMIAYPFALAIANKNTIACNISVFEELKINQIGLSKKNLQFRELFTIW